MASRSKRAMIGVICALPLMLIGYAHAAGRKGSKRAGGTGSSGKGGHYVGGKSAPPPKKGKR